MGANRIIKVLIVEDSFIARELLVHILRSDPEIEVIGTAANGEEAIEFMKLKRPDVITMDINMPVMDGFEATKRIMSTQPVPIVIVTGSYDPEEVSTSFRAIDAGAIALLKKPAGVVSPTHENQAKQLVTTVKLMSEIRLVKRRPLPQPPAVLPGPWPGELTFAQKTPEIRLVAIGASTGGPPVIKKILSGLPKDFPVPILVVQHISSGFISGLINWLEKTIHPVLMVPTNGERILPGNVYFAPDDLHMGVENGDRIVLSDDRLENGSRPSISFLFRSVAKAYGQNAIGVLLTGMGKDGAAELKVMKEKGCVTIIQDKVSSAVYGMPGEALRLDAAVHVLSPEGIAAELIRLITERKTV